MAEPLKGRTAATLAVSAAGGFLAYAMGMPAAWLSGGLLAVAAASLAGLDTQVPQPLRTPAYLILGIYAGAGVSAETLRQIQSWPASFGILAVSMVGVIAGSYWWLHRRCGWDRNAALLSSLPGALSFVIAAGEGLKTDMKKVAISQSIRLLILVEAIPLLALFFDRAGAVPSLPQLPDAGLLDLALLLGAGLAAGFLMERLKFPGGWMLGGLLASAALLLSGQVAAQLPAFLVVPCMIALAAIVGSRFRPGDWAILPSIAGPALGAFTIAAALSFAGAAAVTMLLGVNLIQTLLAFAPGALDALIILAFQMDVDPAYVAAHHLARFLALVAAVPLLARWLDRHP